ncbi:hypothetical protein CPB83DRAFT_843106 [Crepidotus variabilis]|uniref:GST N-terminal domain-containing protein n=1 Tax=Crepidotus variabilis TaxID=179855 RepID=A0A9P6JWD5_9AGAR|nr:hypothetical protein CPB83DRAFT_843106 [Crepidotus variabilis]
MASSDTVIIYRYNASPYSHKVDNVLALKGIPHEQVLIASALPRPEITNQLGIAYRRIPILAVGNDVYCDTGLIVNTLERRFPEAKGYGTIFPPRKQGGAIDTTLINTFSKFYAENALFPLVPTLLPWDRMPDAFLKDRSAFAGAKMNPKAIAARIPRVQSSLLSHIAIIETQLSDSREWLFDTEGPSLADISLHFILAWANSLPGGKFICDEKTYPKASSWLNRMSNLIKAKQSQLGKPSKLSGSDAANKIISSTHEGYERVGFDDDEAQRWKVKRGDIIAVAPEDTGRDWPTIGKLVALGSEELILEVQGSEGLSRVHFPRIGYTLKPAVGSKL